MKTSYNSYKISKLRLFYGLIIGFGYSVLLYLLFYLIREAFRYLSITEDNLILVLSEKEVFFYNTIYAYIAIIMGVGRAISFIIDKPLYFKNSSKIKSSILIDQKVLNWVFLSWISKLGIVFGALFVSLELYFTFSFYPEYKFIFILCVIVLFLQLWTSIVRYLKVNSIELILVSGSLISIFAFILGSINVINYKSLNNIVHLKNSCIKYGISVPVTPSYELSKSNFKDFELYLANTDSQNFPILIYKNKKIQLSELSNIYNNWKSNFPHYVLNYSNIKLIIDNSIKMQFVNELKNKISQELNHKKISYSVFPLAISELVYRCNQYSIPSSLINYKYKSEIDIEADDYFNINNIFISNMYGVLQINAESITIQELKIALKKSVSDKQDYRILFIYDYDITYNSFIQVYSSIRQAILELRNEYALTNFGIQYISLDKNTRKNIDLKYPMSIIEKIDI